MTPRSESIAFRAWQVASRMGWDCTIAEVAEEIGYDYRRLGNIMAARGWTNRFRVSHAASKYASYVHLSLRGANPLTVLVRDLEHQAVRDVQRQGSIQVGAA